MTSTGKATADSKFRKKSINPVQDINLGAYSHQNVDRFGVIMDVWTNEVNFLQMKKNVSLKNSIQCCGNFFYILLRTLTCHFSERS